MKTKTLLLQALCILFPACTFATSYTWNGATSTAWATSTNWTPNGVPGTGDDVTIVSASNDPVYNTAGTPALTNLTVNSGSLDLNGFTLEITGTGLFLGGIVSNGKIESASNTEMTFGGTEFDCEIEASTLLLRLNGSVFNEETSFELVTGGTGGGEGGNIFNDIVTITNSNASNYIALETHEPDTFNSAVYFINDAPHTFYIGYGSPGSYCAEDAYIINNLNNTTMTGYFGSMTFAGDLYIKGASGAILYFGYPFSTGTCTMTEGSLKEYDTGFNSGTIYMNRFTKTGIAPVNLSVGTTSFVTGQNSEFHGKFNYTGSFFLLETIFHDSVSFTHPNSSTNFSAGGNTFNSYAYFKNTGTGSFYMANETGDHFNANAVFETTSTGRIYPAYNDSSYFNGDLTLAGAALSEPAKSDGVIIWHHDTEHYLKREYGGLTRAFYIEPSTFDYVTAFKDLYLSTNEFRGKSWR